MIALTRPSAPAPRDDSLEPTSRPNPAPTVGTAPMISLHRISKTFATPEGPLRAVNNVSLEISPGEIHGIIGFSGAGKSTLVRTINLLERPDADGEAHVRVDGQDLLTLDATALNRARLSIGMIFQHFHLLNNRTVAENVAFPLEIAGVPRKERLPRVYECLDTVGLREKANTYPSKLSGGQRQRVAIARAIANRPKVLLCDEPTSSVDPQDRKSVV